MEERTTFRLGLVELSASARSAGHAREVELVAIETQSGNFGPYVMISEELGHVSLDATGLVS